MASSMKFVYYNNSDKDALNVNNNSYVEEKRLQEVKQRFRRSGSVGVPFVSEDEAKELKHHQPIEEAQEEGAVLFLAMILSVDKTTQAISSVLAALPGQVNVKHIESRDPRPGLGRLLEVFLEVEVPASVAADSVVAGLKQRGFHVQEVSRTEIPSGADEFRDPGSEDALSGSPWFPKAISDLDICGKRVIMYGAGGLDADHPGFKDPEYRKRRMMFADIALNYHQGDPIPRIDYTEQEIKTWGVIYRRLRELHLKHACKEFLDNFELLERYCGYSENNIPQLEDVSNFLREKTGFRIRPVAGYLSARDFLAGLAFRIFNCTQYIRHHADPFYTPEPDTVHELMGHMALFADPEFAQFSQELGLASLGASEEDLKKLATFGLCVDDEKKNQIKGSPPKAIEQSFKIYGAGLLSSAGELVHAVEAKEKILRFDPDRVAQQECMITTFQNNYFFTRNFEEVQQKLRTFTNSMNRPFVVRYNPYTESIEVLNNKRSIMLAVNSIRSDINLLASSLRSIL